MLTAYVTSQDKTGEHKKLNFKALIDSLHLRAFYNNLQLFLYFVILCVIVSLYRCLTIVNGWEKKSQNKTIFSSLQKSTVNILNIDGYAVGVPY